MGARIRFRGAVALSVLLLLAGCEEGLDRVDLLAPDAMAGNVVQLGAGDSDPDFLFLPPIGDDLPRPGPFNPFLATTVSICRVADLSAAPSGCGTSVAALWEFGPDQVRVETDHYHVNWSLKNAAQVETAYRITVRVGDRYLGHADVVAGRNMSQAKKAAGGGEIPVNVNQTLVIRYHAGGCATDACFRGSVSHEGGTVYTADQRAVAVFPEGWFDPNVWGEHVEVIIEEKVPGPGEQCLPEQGGYRQYGTCFMYTTVPDVGEFLEDVYIGQCMDDAAEASGLEDWLSLGAWDVDELVRVLPNVPVPELNCDEPVILGGDGFLGRALRFAASLFTPDFLHAADVGLGGSIRSFSDVAWVWHVTATPVAGAGQQGAPGETLPQDPTVQVQQNHAHLVPGEGGPVLDVHVQLIGGVQLVFTFLGPDDEVLDVVQTVSDEYGQASVPWALGEEPGTYTLVVTGEIMEPVVFQATAVEGEGEGEFGDGVDGAPFPDPILEYHDVESTEGGWIWYIGVANWDAYSDGLFAATDSWICDENESPARTEVRVVDAEGVEIDRSCGVGTAEERLAEVSFFTSFDDEVPDVRILLIDHDTGGVLESNLLLLSQILE